MVAVKIPTFHEERALFDSGITLIAGVDEAGSGCWAGPIFAAAVILPLNSRIKLIRDSKTLSAGQRGRVVEMIKKNSAAWAVGSASPSEIDEMNIRAAGALAMRRAIEGLSVEPEFLLVDAFYIPDCPIRQKAIIKGDSIVKSVAAASVLAKVARDRLMKEMEEVYPGYGFAKHKGYGTDEHRRALAELGPCGIHRMSYAPLREFRARVT